MWQDASLTVLDVLLYTVCPNCPDLTQQSLPLRQTAIARK